MRRSSGKDLDVLQIFLNFRLKAYAQLLMDEDRFDHSDNGVGENLATGTNTSDNILDEAIRSIRDWHDEHQIYDFGNPESDNGTGHFTQVND